MKERLATRALMSAVALVLLAPLPARAQTAEGWRIDFIPPYFWATSLRGDLAAGPPTLPIDLDFDQAAEHLAGAFSFHLETSRGPGARPSISTSSAWPPTPSSLWRVARSQGISSSTT